MILKLMKSGVLFSGEATTTFGCILTFLAHSLYAERCPQKSKHISGNVNINIVVPAFLPWRSLCTKTALVTDRAKSSVWIWLKALDLWEFGCYGS
jgi:hypothetical protein